MIGAWLNYGPKRSQWRRRRRPSARQQPPPRRVVRHGPAQARQRLYRVLLVFLALVLLGFVLTVNVPCPLVVGAPLLRALHVLPMVGFVVLLAAGPIAALAVLLVGQRSLALPILLGGLVGAVSLSLLTSNLLRAPVLASVGTRLGARTADQVAREKDGYERIAFTPEMLGPMARCLLPSDEPRIRSAFYLSYLSAFEGRYYALVDRDAQREEGYNLGYDLGKVAGAQAAARRQKLEENPSDPTLLNTLRDSELPWFVEGFEKGYEDGWRAGYLAGAE